jgi:hypothetical protein
LGGLYVSGGVTNPNRPLKEITMGGSSLPLRSGIADLLGNGTSRGISLGRVRHGHLLFRIPPQGFRAANGAMLQNSFSGAKDFELR